MRSTLGSGAITRLLLVDRDFAGSQVLAGEIGALLGTGDGVTCASSGHQAAGILRQQSHDVVLADLGSIGDLAENCELAVSRLVKLSSGALVVALSEGMSVSAAVESMRAGAHDYVAKPVSGQALATRIEELALRHCKPRAMVMDELPSGENADFEGFVGRSTQMQCVFDQIVRIAPSSAPVFITGESGTGKEIAAEALHTRGPRAKKPFVAINCGAIPRDLMETELFGVVRGAFTGAVEDRKGAAELANGGTLFLDEIGEMDLSLQTKLLRFLQTGTVTRVGEGAARPVDVRVICATNRNPMQLITEKKFREDLFYRLHVLPIHIPPLRQRPADIMPLAKHFLARYSAEEKKYLGGFSPETADMFMSREWRGNVRQLQNLIRRIVVMFDGKEVNAEMVSAADIETRGIAYQTQAAKSTRRSPHAIEPMWRQEQRIIEDALELFHGNIAQAAAALEISPSTIYRKKQSWEQMLAGAA